MPGSAMDGSIVVESAPQLNYERLRLALRDAALGTISPAVAGAVLGEMMENRKHISSPLGPELLKRPDPTDRAQIEGRSVLSLTLPSRDGVPSQRQVPLSSEHIAVALSLSSELDINEMDAALLLVNARTEALHHPDTSVVDAAKQLFDIERRESMHYLQELLRAPLVPAPANVDAQNFVASIVQERDNLVTQHHIIAKIVERMQKAINLNQSKSTNTRDALREGEAVLLSECLFLLAYTVQITSAEALSIRDLLESIAELYKTLLEQESQVEKPNQWAVGTPEEPMDSGPDQVSEESEIKSVSRVELESVRNLVLLSWICALDRSRYQDVYDPRTGESGINVLLRDDRFISQTANLPPLTEDGEDKVSGLDEAVNASSLAAAVFRLAIAHPDEAEAVSSAVRVSAYGGALSYLANDLANWIESGAGSLCPDADLYADALEDLALDMAEAPNLSNALMSFTQNEVVAAASEAAFASFDEGSRMDDAHFPSASPPAQAASTPSFLARNSGGQGVSKPPLPAPSPSGRPPIPPNRPPSLPRTALTLESPRSNAFQHAFPKTEPDLSLPAENKPQDASAFRFGESNLIALLARFAGRAIKLAPKKLLVDSISSGPRYWVAVGAPVNGLIPRIGDAVIDIWDAASKNAHAPGGVGEAFVEALDGFLALLCASAGPDGSSVHSASALRYLLASGHPVVNINLTSKALQHFSDLLSSPTTPRGTMFEDAEVKALCGILDVITAAAEGLKSDGGVGPILAEAGKDLSIRIASLAVHDVSPKLKASLVSALTALDERRAISLFLENASVEKSSSLRRLIRAYEGETGTYDVTVRVLQLAEECTKWSEEDYPASAVDSIATWFAIEEVLLNWSRRKYATEYQRWSVVKAAASLLLSLSQRAKLNEERLLLVWGRLLLPAPGTGTASSALRALIAACGLLRYPEDASLSTQNSTSSHPSGKYMQSWGRQLLLQSADHGLGNTYREMERVVGVCSRVISGLFEIPPGLAASLGLLVATPGELLAAETASLHAAATMVFSVNCGYPNAYKAGYSQASCKSVLAMLATAATHSSNICSLLARDTPGLPSTAAPFRSSLSDIIAHGGGEFDEDLSISSEPAEEPENKREEPIMHSALRIVENCLGSDGGSPPGLFLLGLQLDTSGRYVGASYGVLEALIELVAGVTSNSGRMDSKSRATASVFLQRLVANTVRKTSRAVLEHIRAIGAADKWIRGGGFADEMLFKILEFTSSYGTEARGSEEDFNWRSLAEFATSCMSLSALQVRIFPGVELERTLNATAGRRQPTIRSDTNHTNVRSFNGAPSPVELFRMLELMAKCESHDVVFEAFRSWYILLGVRIHLYSQRPSHASVPLYLELVELLLSALANSDGSTEVSALIKKDGGQTACAAILICVQHICDTQKAQNKESQDVIDEYQSSALLRSIVRGIAGLAGSSADVSRGRTSLYAAFLQVGQLVESLASDEGVARAFGGRVGSRQVSGTEAVLSSVCVDAASGPTPATMAVALAAACWTTHLDPIRAVPALSSQNRLRRIVARTIADAEARALMGSACSRSRTVPGISDAELARENAAFVVGDATLSLIQSISTCSNGARALVDSGCVEALVALLSALERSRRAHITTEGQGNETEELIGPDKQDVEDDSEEFDDVDGPVPGEKRAALVGSISSAMASAMTCADPILIDGAMALLEKGNGCFTDVLRMVRSGRPAFLEALSALSLILSRAPPSVTVSSREAGQLRLSLAGALNLFVSPRRTTPATEQAISNLCNNFLRRRPLSSKEARAMKVWHPYGGSLFDRDVAAERIACLHSVMAALRSPHRLQELFKTSLGGSRDHGGVTFMDDGGLVSGTRDSMRKIPVGDLMDVVRICRASLLDIRRFSEESLQANTFSSGETTGGLSAQKLEELTAFCEAKYGLLDRTEGLAPVTACMQKESEYLRGLSNRCISIFESALFILREYMRAGRGALRGEPDFDIDAEFKLNSESAKQNMSPGEAQGLIEQAKDVILPLCKEIDMSTVTSWGSKDPSFCKQLSRQIRAYIGQ